MTPADDDDVLRRDFEADIYKRNPPGDCPADDVLAAFVKRYGEKPSIYDSSPALTIWTLKLEGYRAGHADCSAQERLCEWREWRPTSSYWIPGCDQRRTDFFRSGVLMDQYKFCPFCGGRITIRTEQEATK